MNHRNRRWRWAACLALIGALVCACTRSPGSADAPTTSAASGTAPPSPTNPAATGPSDSDTTQPATAAGGPPASGAATAGGGNGDGDGRALIPTADRIRDIGVGLPDDPSLAAEHLVRSIYTADEVTANAATAEVLRRAGVPLVSADGPVIAMPGHFIAANHPTYVEFVPIVTRSVRSGAGYAPGEIAELLADAELTSDTVDPAQITRALALWGKAADNATESVVAGAAVRASSWQRGQQLVPGDDLVRIDALQVLLLLVHATADPVEMPATANRPSSLRSRGATGNLCDEFADSIKEGKRVDPTLAGAQERAAKKIFSESLKNALVQAGVEVGTIKDFSKILGKFNTYAKLKSAEMLRDGITVKITDDKSGTTHFRHQAGSSAENVTFTATATFWSPLEQDYLSCYDLAGFSVPPNGPLKGSDGFRVLWSSSERVHGKTLLQARAGEGYKFGGHRTGTGELLANATGTSTLAEYPRVEKQPPPPGNPNHLGVHQETIYMYAQLLRNDGPKSVWDFADMASFGSLGTKWLTQYAYPQASHPFVVEYHAPNPVVIKAHGMVGMPLAGQLDLIADLYSCHGLQGPWQGSFTLRAKDTGLKALLEATGLGSRAEKGGYTVDDVSFEINTALPAYQTQQVVIYEDVGMLVIPSRDLVGRDEHIDGDLGEVRWTLNGEDLTPIRSWWSWQSGLSAHIVGVPSDKRCPGVGVYENGF